jgi:hypothetical protein
MNMLARPSAFALRATADRPPSALRPPSSVVRPLPSALCPLPSALCPPLSALRPPSSVVRPLPSALCPHEFRAAHEGPTHSPPASDLIRFPFFRFLSFLSAIRLLCRVTFEKRCRGTALKTLARPPTRELREVLDAPVVNILARPSAFALRATADRPPSALRPLPSALRPLPSALCPLPSALCPPPSSALRSQVRLIACSSSANRRMPSRTVSGD